jgi:outer membrane lipoprotein-sorting protein
MRRLALVAVALSLAACPLPPVARPYPPPTAADLVAAIRAHAAKVQSLRTGSRVDHMGQNGERVKVHVQMAMVRGGKLRFDIESPIGESVLATLVSDGKRFALLDTRENRFLTGTASACNVSRLVRIDLAPDDILDALTGGAPLDGEAAGVAWDPSHGGREVLTLRAPDGGVEELKLDGRDRRWDVLEAERRDSKGRVLWRLAHESFDDVGGVRLPAKITVEQPPEKADAIIKLREPELNPPVPDSLFHLEPPSGITPEEVGCAG